MAVPEQTPYQEYTANGVATSFAVAFQCLSKDTLIVTINGVEQSSVLWNFTGGNVVFIAAPANLSIIGIKRSTALSREITYQTHDNSFRPSVLNGDIDRLWHVLQENQLIYDKKVDKAAQIQTLGNLQGGGAIGLGLTLSLKDQTVTADYQFGSSIKIPVITLNQDGTVKSLHEVDMIGGGGGAFQIGWGDVLNKPTTLNGYGITDAYTKTEANSAFIEDSEKGAKNGVATLGDNLKVPVEQLPTATEVVTGVAKIATTAIARAGTNDTDIITAKKLRDALNASGGAPIYAFRASAMFNGTNGISGSTLRNISSVERLAVGYYKCNFATAMSDTNYGVKGCANPTSGVGNGTVIMVLERTTAYFTFYVKTGGTNTTFDVDYIYVEVS